jgi:hypothetical protein
VMLPGCKDAEEGQVSNRKLQKGATFCLTSIPRPREGSACNKMLLDQPEFRGESERVTHQYHSAYRPRSIQAGTLNRPQWMKIPSLASLNHFGDS